MSINKTKKDMCLLVGAAELYLSEELELEHAYIIAADGGYESLRQRGIIPDAVIGDFDSLGYVPTLDNVEVLPTVKDDTDIFYAAKKAYEAGYRNFYFCGCAEGERADHTYANISVMRYLARRGAECVMEGESCFYRVISGQNKLVLEGCKGCFSALALSDCVEGVTLRGLEYETEGVCMYSDIPIGVSNRFASQVCEIEIQKGDMLLIWEK